MGTALSLLFSLALVPACAAQTWATVKYEKLPGVAVYSRGYLLSWDSPQYTLFTLYGRDAKPAFSAPEQMGDSSPVMWAVDSDGVVAGAYGQNHSSEGRIDLLNLTGAVTNTISTGSYIPQQVVFAPDHTIWTVGFNARNSGAQDFNVFHHYARSGEELGQAVPWSQLSDNLEHPTIANMRAGPLLYVASDRLGWNATLHYGFRTWVEVSFSGALLGKYELKASDGHPLFPSIMTAAGNVYANVFKSKSDGFKTPSARFAILDRSKGVWQKVVGSPTGILVGSEGDNLVFLTQEGPWTTLKFAPSGSLRIETP